MSSKLFIRILGIAGCCAALSSCGGGSEDSNSGETPVTNTPISISDYDKLSRADVEAKILKPATEDELTMLLINGVRLNVLANSQVLFAGSAIDSALPAAPSPSSARESEFSSTNTHVRGVDEADFVKYDGQYIYMATHPEYIWGEEPPEAEIRILQTDPDNAGVSEISSISVDNDIWGEVSELYLMTDEQQTLGLVTLRSSWSYIAASEPLFSDVAFDVFPIPYRDKIQLASYDVRAPTMPTQNFTVEIDGYLQNSRKIGNTIYLVTQYSPFLPFIDFALTSNEQAEENEEKIASLRLDDLLPKVSINGGAAEALVKAEDCLIPVDTDANQGYLNMVTIVAVDLESQRISSAKCLNTHVSGIYATTDNIYLGGSANRPWSGAESFTVVHKFALGGDIDYRATGVVPGWLGWQDPSFRMNEHDDRLRIVTTTRSPAINNNEPMHWLSILEESNDSDELNLIAQLPNDVNPEPIGKPGEDIYAVRFMGDRAFIVTFERIDPLYVVDLSDALNPSIAGELEVPGYSSYLHPVGDDYLLGVGQDADDTGRETGLKVSLFDIANISAPELVGSEIIGQRGTWSIALHDLRAISFLSPNNDQLRFAFPVSVYNYGATWTEESLFLMEINGLENNSAMLSNAGKITAESSGSDKPWPSFSGTDRGILHKDAVYYTHGNSVWASFWSSPDAATGPH